MKEFNVCKEVDIEEYYCNKDNYNKQYQSTADEIVNILQEVIIVDTHDKIQVGTMVSPSRIRDIFGRVPQEGINFCADTKELFIITKIGRDNPVIEDADYNDYWKDGKIIYEGRGQKYQEFKGSNLHLYRRYQYTMGLNSTDKAHLKYVHAFNCIGDKTENKYQYLGKFYITDFRVNSYSLCKIKPGEYKKSLIFELTPKSRQCSLDIDLTYNL